MGAVAAEANDFWARVQTAENQQLPDTKARVRFLLDEIALLETRFESRKHHHQIFSGDPPEKLFSDESSGKHEEEVEPQGQEPESEAEPQHDDNGLDVSNEASVNDSSRAMISVHTRGDEFLQFIEEKLHTLVNERVGFFETAENELRIGKVERPELAKLLRLEKSKLQRHRLELDEFREEWTCWQKEEVTRTSCLWKAVQEIIEEFVRLLDDREGLQLKLEVQVELGHFFRLLKLLEVQRARDENSKRELERKIQEFRELLENEKELEPVDDATNSEDRERKQEVDRAGDSNPESEPEINIPESTLGVQEIEADRDSETAMNGDVSTAGDFRECRKEAKQEILMLMADQEQRWKDQLDVLREMEHRLASSELETRRVSSLLEERCPCDCNTKVDQATASTSVSTDIPQGYTSIYFSPIFQERKPNPRAHRDEKDAEIQRLRKEVSRLKEARENQVLDRVSNPPEEKTILVDESFKPDELVINSSGFLVRESLDSFVVCSDLSEGDKTFCEKAVQQMFQIVEQHMNELSSRKLQTAAEVEKAFVGAFSSMSLQFHQLSEDLQVHFKMEAPQASENELKAEMDRLAGKHAQELERKEKTLAYAQELNLQLANDMSRKENALTELRTEHVAVKLSLETKLKASKGEADALAEMLRREITSLEEKLRDKDQVMLETTSRAEACQRETDAAVLEKNSFLERLQRALNELEEQNLKIQRLEHEDHERGEGTSSQLQEAREELKRASESQNNLERRYSELQTKLLDTEYELAQREAALERLTLHLAASTAFSQEGGVSQEVSSLESLRSKHWRREQARKSIHEAEEKMLEISTEMARAKSEMEEMKSQSFHLLRKLRMK